MYYYYYSQIGTDRRHWKNQPTDYIPKKFKLMVAFPFFLLFSFSSNLTLSSSPLSLTTPISRSISHATFAVFSDRSVALETAAEYKSIEVVARHVATAEAEFANCKFHALSSVRGEVDETSGGAVYSDRVKLGFKSCSFSGNSAVTGGAAAFLRSSVSFELCNFTNNRATFEAGVLSFDSASGVLNECNFVQNEAELYVGVIKGVNATIEGEALIFQGNRAVFHSAVVSLDGSTAQFTAAQFSGNVVDNEMGGVVHYLQESRLKLRGCTFETIPRVLGNASVVRQPIRADAASTVIIRQGCFDTPEDIFKQGIEGDYSGSIGIIFTDRCPCAFLVVPHPYDVIDTELKLVDSLLTARFLLTAAGLAILALVIVVLVVCDGTRAQSQWVSLI
jgi:hypothetical protein